MPVTMRDVAQKAGVSLKTVARILQAGGEIAAETRARVLAVSDELGYHPNLIAHDLITERTHTVGIVIADITNPYFAMVVRGAQDIARYKSYHVLLCNTYESQQEELRTLQALADQGVDGIIMFPGFYTGNNLEIFAEQFRPLVVVNHVFQHPNVSLVLTNNYEGARTAVEYLIHKGHRAIGLLAGRELSPARGQRVRGYRDALTAHELPIVEERILGGSPTQETGYENALQLFAQAPDTTAIFAYNDLMALGAIKACREVGRRVPEDCAVIGFDDTLFASLTMPPLTTIRLDKYGTGRQAMARLLAMMDAPDATFDPIELDVELVVRASA
jgi:DNA-binding LacI/PurR family transcriptional regulator